MARRVQRIKTALLKQAIQNLVDLGWRLHLGLAVRGPLHASEVRQGLVSFLRFWHLKLVAHVEAKVFEHVCVHESDGDVIEHEDAWIADQVRSRAKLPGVESLGVKRRLWHRIHVRDVVVRWHNYHLGLLFEVAKAFVNVTHELIEQLVVIKVVELLHVRVVEF